MVDILRLSLCTLGLERRREGEINQFTKNFTDLPGSTVVKNLPSNAGDSGSIPGRGTKLLRAAGQLSTRATTGAQVWVPQVERSRVPKENFHVPQLRPDTAIQK